MITENEQYILNSAIQTLNNREYNLKHLLNKHGFSERIVEVPWAARWLKGSRNILDIGFTMSSLDWMGLLLTMIKEHAAAIDAIDIIKPERVITRYPLEWQKEILNTPITIGDLRTIEVKIDHYDVVTCISTLEHIGFDEASDEDPNTAFNRGKTIEEVATRRAESVNQQVLSQFHKTLKPGGIAIISVPMGKGGATLLQDSLGLYTRQWEYEKESWADLTNQPGFEIVDECFFGITNKHTWQQVESPIMLSDKSSELLPHAQGCALIALRKTYP